MDQLIATNMDEIIQINLDINKRIRYVADPKAHNGKRDIWQTPEQTVERGTGDCEDYALLKQDELQKKEIESFVVTGKDYQGNAHAVCVVRCVMTKGFWLWKKTYKADAVLDNQTPIVHDINNSGFKEVSRYDRRMVQLMYKALGDKS